MFKKTDDLVRKGVPMLCAFIKKQLTILKFCSLKGRKTGGRVIWGAAKTFRMNKVWDGRKRTLRKYIFMITIKLDLEFSNY